jgi:hypothetical protein
MKIFLAAIILTMTACSTTKPPSIVEVLVPVYIDPPVVNYKQLGVLPVKQLSRSASFQETAEAYLTSLMLQRDHIDMLEDYLDLYSRPGDSF